jgi:hypothetical protein
MRSRLLAVVVVVVAVVFSSGRALARRDGETASPVTVREAPSDDAPAVRDLPAGAPVIAHAHKNGWVRISGAARGWIPNSGFAAASDDTTQEQALLAQIAAAAESEPQARTDADLMYDALKKWRGEPPDSAKIDRVVAQSQKESDRNRKVTREKIKAMFWKDPFSEDPRRLIPVRKVDRDLLATRAPFSRARGDADAEADAPRARSSHNRGDGSGEVARLRSELAAARADMAEARSEISRLRGELSRAQASVDDSGERGEARFAGESHVRRQASNGHARHLADRSEGLGTDGPRPQRRHKALGPTVLITTTPAAVPAAAPEIAPLPPADAHSSDPRGIIVVPIESPVPPRADTKPAHR